jgi:hypothetical protein
MSFLDNLKNFIEAKLNIHLNNVNFININIVRGEESQAVKHDPNSNRYVIDVSRLSDDEYKEISNISRKYVEEGNLLLEKKSLDLLNELYVFKRTQNSTLEFFRDIIPQADLEALRASLFIREKFRKGEQINNLKYDIIMRFGDRGRNISNLCSAGYFEEFLIPLYNSESKDKFNEIYEDLIKNSMLTVFVNSKMNADDIPKEIEKKILISKKYGFKFIHVHGIGQRNINTIKQFINSKRTELFNIEKIRYSNPKEHILIVELILS